MGGAYRLEKGTVGFAEQLYCVCIIVVIIHECQHIKRGDILRHFSLTLCRAGEAQIDMIDVSHLRYEIGVAVAGVGGGAALGDGRAVIYYRLIKAV